MRLFASPTSPYARKVQICLFEKGLMNQVAIIAISPLEPGSETIIPGPLGRVPVLELEDGTAVYDSPVICEVVDGLRAEPTLIPSEPSARQAVLINQALADGLLDSAFQTVMEGRRPDAERSSYWLDRWDKSIRRAVAAMNAEIAGFGTDVDLAHISFAAALGYLDFRLPPSVSGYNWRADAPTLATWFAGFQKRDSFKKTEPKT